MKLLPIRRGEITRTQVGFSVVPVIRRINNVSSRAGSRARTKTAACGAANRGFESHPARQYPFGAQNDELVLYSVLYCSRALQWRLERWFSTPELSWRGARELSLESLLLNIRTLANF